MKLRPKMCCGGGTIGGGGVGGTNGGGGNDYPLVCIMFSKLGRSSA
jgi:hypothetical protein